MGHGQPEVAIVGTGTDGGAHIGAEAESWAKANSASLLIQPSYDAIVKLNELAEGKKRFGGLTHKTC